MKMKRGQFERARGYLYDLQLDFCDQWSSLHPLALAPRRELLGRLQRMAEAEELLHFVDLLDNFTSDTMPLEMLLCTWSRRDPDRSPESLPMG